MVGCDSGRDLMQDKPMVITYTTSPATWLVGGGSHWSSRSLRSNSVLFDNNVIDDREFKSSPGYFPIMISNATTPKLKRSHFVVTRIVSASSGGQEVKATQPL
ncbi:hypothetical protein GOBAR_AA11957 [Gossypium barbadense]|uniref:Uncharacterized protein n=1 Tax=Gossypium barbadense TaxID=3634 RepID=A0A2P5XZB4_GOSBA|nr:hypothetical protein GOBAR_AA11957 [Gossypium barbadense]